jgi:hypothetical protein
MQQLTVHVPDNKIAFFIDLATNLGFVVENNIQQNILTEKQIELVNEARKNITAHPELFLDWEEARKTLDVE